MPFRVTSAITAFTSRATVCFCTHVIPPRASQLVYLDIHKKTAL
jgi:hypothetical protein